MPLFRPAIVLHGALAVAAFAIALASSAGWDGMTRTATAQLPVARKDVLEHAEAVYRTRRYGEAEDALRCAGFGDLSPTRGSHLAIADKDHEVVPHPAVKYAAGVDLPRLGTGTSLCAYLQQAGVRQWYLEQFMH